MADELAELVGALVAEAVAELFPLAVVTGAVALWEAAPSVLELLAEAGAEWAPELVPLGWLLVGSWYPFSRFLASEDEVQAAKSRENRVKGLSKAGCIGSNCHEPGMFVAPNVPL